MDNETMGLLRRLGLNQYESKVYFSLLRSGSTSASEIGTLADIPRPRTYDVLDKLEKRGFITIQPGRPTKFKAAALDETFELLKSKKEDEFKKSVNEIGDIKVHLSDKLKNSKESKKDKDEYLWIIKDRKNIHSKIEGMINSAKASIIISTTANGLDRKMGCFEDALRKANKRGVSIKIITPSEDTVCVKRASEFAEIIKRDSNQRAVVTDNDVLLFLTPETHEKEVGTWIRSPYMAKNFRSLF
jgi:sugar-specific transcriptional regulator TrmB